MAYDELPPPPVPQPAVRYSRPVSTGATITVACKVPNGLLLRCFDEDIIQEPQQGGGFKPVKQSRPIPGKQFVIKGPWVATAGQAFRRNNPAIAELLPGDYALTHGVPRDIWDHWYRQNKDTPLVQKGVVFACPVAADAAKEAQQRREVKSGLEPLNPDKPASRMPGGQTRAERQVRLDILQEGDGGR